MNTRRSISERGGTPGRSPASQPVACGDILERDGDVLVLHAFFPIEGLEPSRFRTPILVVDHERFALVAKDGPAQAPRYTLRARNADDEAHELYEPGGVVIVYDADRHLDRAQDRRRSVIAWVLFVALLPCMPLLGFLPAGVKRQLPAIGINPVLASTLSIPLQHGAAALCLVAHYKAGFIFTAQGLAFAALAFLLVTDAAYRTSEHRDGRAPGLMALPAMLVGLVLSVVGAAYRGRDA